MGLSNCVHVLGRSFDLTDHLRQMICHLKSSNEYRTGVNRIETKSLSLPVEQEETLPVSRHKKPRSRNEHTSYIWQQSDLDYQLRLPFDR